MWCLTSGSLSIKREVFNSYDNTREKIGFHCTNYFRSIVVLVLVLATALSKFCFRSYRNKMINLVLVSFRFAIAVLHQYMTTCNYMTYIYLEWSKYCFSKYTIRLKMKELRVVDFVFLVILSILAYLKN